MSRISFAFRSFFSILFGGTLPADIAEAFGYTKAAAKPAAPPKPQAGPADGALQILAILQRDARLIDFLMEDIASYADEQVGAAVRNLHAECRQALDRHLRLAPVIDGVEGAYTKLEGADPAEVKLLGKVPVSGKAPGGVLRHKGWRAERIDLPAPASVGGTIVAPAEVEIE